jgi:ADP-ribose pyrophosphatase YjhB (NUDIX family)/DNA polymerase III epsilon subunit-like protein
MSNEKKRRELSKIQQLSLYYKVQSLVEKSNENILPERQVSFGAALTVAEREIRKNTTGSADARIYGALRAVSAFVSLASRNKITTASLQNSDLLSIGHPLSTKFHKMDEAALRHARAQWIAADTHINSEAARALVASAHSLEPGSIERRHAFARLAAMGPGLVPITAAVDLEPIIAVLGLGLGGNSRAARSARARLQRRDRKGRFAFQGGSWNFSVRFPDGSHRGVTGKVVGQSGVDDVEVEVRDNKYVPNGVYAVPASRGIAAKATLKKSALKGLPDRDAEVDPEQRKYSIDSNALKRMDSPSAWKKVQSSDPKMVSFTTADGYRLDVPANDKGEADFSGVNRGTLRRAVGNQMIANNIDGWDRAESAALMDQDSYQTYLNSPEGQKALSKGGWGVDVVQEDIGEDKFKSAFDKKAPGDRPATDISPEVQRLVDAENERTTPSASGPGKPPTTPPGKALAPASPDEPRREPGGALAPTQSVRLNWQTEDGPVDQEGLDAWTQEFAPGVTAKLMDDGSVRMSGTEDNLRNAVDKATDGDYNASDYIMDSARMESDGKPTAPVTVETPATKKAISAPTKELERPVTPIPAITEPGTAPEGWETRVAGTKFGEPNEWTHIPPADEYGSDHSITESIDSDGNSKFDVWRKGIFIGEGDNKRVATTDTLAKAAEAVKADMPNAQAIREKNMPKEEVTPEEPEAPTGARAPFDVEAMKKAVEGITHEKLVTGPTQYEMTDGDRTDWFSEDAVYDATKDGYRETGAVRSGNRMQKYRRYATPSGGVSNLEGTTLDEKKDSIKKVRGSGDLLNFSYNGKNRQVQPGNIYVNKKNGETNIVTFDHALGEERTYNVSKMEAPIPEKAKVTEAPRNVEAVSGKEPQPITSTNLQDVVADVQKAIDGQYPISFKYSGKNRVFTPERIYKNPKTGTTNVVGFSQTDGEDRTFIVDKMTPSDVAPAPAQAPAATGDVIDLNPKEVNKIADIKKFVQDAVDNDQKLRFTYSGKDRVVTPESVWQNGQTGRTNLKATDSDGTSKNFAWDKIVAPDARDAEKEARRQEKLQNEREKFQERLDDPGNWEQIPVGIPTTSYEWTYVGPTPDFDEYPELMQDLLAAREEKGIQSAEDSRPIPDFDERAGAPSRPSTAPTGPEQMDKTKPGQQTLFAEPPEISPEIQRLVDAANDLRNAPDEDILPALEKAVEDKQDVAFDFNDKTRVVAPTEIVENKAGKKQLKGFSKTDGEDRTFTIDKINKPAPDTNVKVDDIINMPQDELDRLVDAAWPGGAQQPSAPAGSQNFRRIKTPESSSVEEMSFDPATGELLIKFKSREGKGGGTYLYPNVNPADVDAIEKADSIGSAVGKFVKGRAFEKLNEKQVSDWMSSKIQTPETINAANEEDAKNAIANLYDIATRAAEGEQVSDQYIDEDGNIRQRTNIALPDGRSIRLEGSNWVLRSADGNKLESVDASEDRPEEYLFTERTGANAFESKYGISDGQSTELPNGEAGTSFTVDVASEDETLDEVIGRFKEAFPDGDVNIVSPEGEGGGWPVVEFSVPEGSEEEFAKWYNGDADGSENVSSELTGPEDDGTLEGDIDEGEAAAFDEEAFDSMFVAPDGAYKPNIFGVYRPKGRTTQESSDYTDDPAVLSRKFNTAQLAMSMTQGLMNADERNGMARLKFDAGMEDVPVEALLEALELTGLDKGVLLSGAYARLAKTPEQKTAANNATKNIQKVVEDTPYGKITSSNAAKINGMLGAPDYTANAVKLVKNHNETNPFIIKLAREIESSEDVDTIETESPEQGAKLIAKYIDWALSDDPEKQEAFRAFWGLQMAADGNDAGGINWDITDFYRGMVEEIARRTGDTFEDAGREVFVKEIVKKYGDYKDFAEGRQRISKGVDDLTADTSTAAMYRLVAESAIPNDVELQRRIYVQTDSKDFTDQTTVGNTIDIDPRSMSSIDQVADETDYGSTPSNEGQAKIIFSFAPGEVDAVRTRNYSWLPGEEEYFGYGTFTIERVEPIRERVYEVVLRRATPAEQAQPAEQVAPEQVAPAPAQASPTVPYYGDISGWKQVGGQSGSNEGGVYEDENGRQFYVKRAKSQSHAENEALASAFYRHFGIPSSEVGLATRDDQKDSEPGTYNPAAGSFGSDRIVTPMIPGTETLQSSRSDEAITSQLHDGFAIDAWLSNYDVIGLVYDNIVVDEQGNTYRIDPGGALKWRAQGKPKDWFGPEVGELDSMRDRDINQSAGSVFGKMTPEQIVESGRKLLNITPSQIDDIVDSVISDPTDREMLKDVLKRRRSNILDQLGIKDTTVDPFAERIPLTDSIGYEAQDLQPGDVIGDDSFVIERIFRDGDTPKNKVSVQGYFPGHESQRKEWNETTIIPAARGGTIPPKGDKPALHRPKAPRKPSPGAFNGKMAELLKDAKTWEEAAAIIRSTPIVYFDYETTGLPGPEKGGKNMPVQIGGVVVKDGKVVARFSSYMNPEHELSDWSAKNLKQMDGSPVTDEWLTTQPLMKEAHEQFISFINENIEGDVILGGQYTPFDLEVLNRILNNNGLSLNIAGTIDSKDIAEGTLPKWNSKTKIGASQISPKDGKRRASNSLGPVADFLQVQLPDWHRADADAEASWEITDAMLERAIENPDTTPTTLLNVDGAFAAKQSQLADYEKEYAKYEADLAEYVAAKAIAAAWNCGGSGLTAAVGPANGPCSVPDVEKMVREATPLPIGEIDPEGVEGGSTSKPTSMADTQEIDDPKYDGVDTNDPYKDEPFMPTEEQRTILDAILTGDDVVVEALAGTGKTSTLLLAGKRKKKERPNERGVYIAFNKSAQLEAERKFADAGLTNIEVVTNDAIAYRWAPDDIKKKMKRLSKTNPLAYYKKFAEAFGITEFEGNDGATVSLFEATKFFKEVVNKFMISADDEIGQQHFDAAGRGGDVPNWMMAIANNIWSDYQDPNGNAKINNTVVTKMWALSKPDLSKIGSGTKFANSFIFFDEAQDINPVSGKVIGEQPLQVVYVGDNNQAIYAFRGGENQLEKVDRAVQRLPLTKSFRFGENIAKEANKWLQLLGTDLRVIGAGSDPGTVVPNGSMLDTTNAILVRTNGGGFAAIADQLGRGRIVGVTKNYRGDLVSLTDTAEYLITGQNKPSQLHEDLAPFKSWSEVQKAIADELIDSKKLQIFADMVDAEGIPAIREMIDKLKLVKGSGEIRDMSEDDTQADVGDTAPGATGELGKGITYAVSGSYVSLSGNTYGNKDAIKETKRFKYNGVTKTWDAPFTSEADTFDLLNDLSTALGLKKAEPTEVDSGAIDVMITTVHQAKGLEWDYVTMWNDFWGPRVDKVTGEVIMPEPTELKIAYVAVTRAKKMVDLGPLDWINSFVKPEVPTAEEEVSAPTPEPTAEGEGGGGIEVPPAPTPTPAEGGDNNEQIIKSVKQAVSDAEDILDDYADRSAKDEKNIKKFREAVKDALYAYSGELYVDTEEKFREAAEFLEPYSEVGAGDLQSLMLQAADAADAIRISKTAPKAAEPTAPEAAPAKALDPEWRPDDVAAPQGAMPTGVAEAPDDVLPDADAPKTAQQSAEEKNKAFRSDANKAADLQQKFDEFDEAVELVTGEDTSLMASDRKRVREAAAQVAEIRKALGDGTMSEQEALAQLNAILDKFPHKPADSATSIDNNFFRDMLEGIVEVLTGQYYWRPTGKSLPPLDAVDPSGRPVGYSRDGKTFITPGMRVRDKWGYSGTVEGYNEKDWINVYIRYDIDPRDPASVKKGNWGPGVARKSMNPSTLTVLNPEDDTDPWIDLPTTPASKKLPQDIVDKQKKDWAKLKAARDYEAAARQAELNGEPVPPMPAGLALMKPSADLVRESKKTKANISSYFDDSYDDQDIDDATNEFSLSKESKIVASDAVIITSDDNGTPMVLMISRLHGPFKGAHALPGGFRDAGESFEAAADREMMEEVGISSDQATSRTFLGEVDANDWDPRAYKGAYVGAVAYEVPKDTPLAAGDDATGARWITIPDIIKGTTPIAFGHATWLAEAFKGTKYEAPLRALVLASKERNARLINQINAIREQKGFPTFDVPTLEVWTPIYPEGGEQSGGDLPKADAPSGAPVSEAPTSKWNDYTVSRGDDGVYYAENISSSDVQLLRNGTLTPPNLPFFAPLGGGNDQETGEGYYFASDGKRYWGRFGAEGALVRRKNKDGNYEYFLAKRSSNLSSGGGKWGFPGGAHTNKKMADTPTATAKEEFMEEVGGDISGLSPVFIHSGKPSPDWSYETVVFEVGPGELGDLSPKDGENSEVGWFTADEIMKMGSDGKLHSAFQDSAAVIFSEVEEKQNDNADDEEADAKKEAAIKKAEKNQKKLLTHKRLVEEYKSQGEPAKGFLGAIDMYQDESASVNITASQMVSPDPKDQARAADGFDDEFQFAEYVGIITDITDAINKVDPLSEDTLLYRAVKGYGGVGRAINELNVGDEFVNEGFSSTSLDKGKAMFILNLADENKGLLKMVAPAGTRGIYVDAAKDEKDEFEFLLQRGTKFRVVGKGNEKHEYLGDVPVTFVEIVSQDPKQMNLLELGIPNIEPDIASEPEMVPAENKEQGSNETWTLTNISSELPRVIPGIVVTAAQTVVPVDEKGNVQSSYMFKYAGRPIVMIGINGVKVPFYMSTGAGGKKNVDAGKWYPIFGISPVTGWFNKGLTEQAINEYHNSPELRAVAEWLNGQFPDALKRKDLVEVDSEGQGNLEYLFEQVNESMPGTVTGYGGGQEQHQKNIDSVVKQIKTITESSVEVEAKDMYANMDEALRGFDPAFDLFAKSLEDNSSPDDDETRQAGAMFESAKSALTNTLAFYELNNKKESEEYEMLRDFESDMRRFDDLDYTAFDRVRQLIASYRGILQRSTSEDWRSDMAERDKKFIDETARQLFDAIQFYSSRSADVFVDGFNKGKQERLEKSGISPSGRPKVEKSPEKFPLTRSYVDGVPSLSEIVEYAVAKREDDGLLGKSALVDSADIEDLDVHASTIITPDGERKLRLRFKLTPWAMLAQETKLQDAKALKTTDGGKWSEATPLLKRTQLTDTGDIVVDEEGRGFGRGTEWVYDAEDNNAKASITITSAQKIKGTAQIANSTYDDAPAAFHGQVVIDLPIDATLDDISEAMKTAGVNDVTSASSDDIDIVIENKLLSLFSNENDPANNVSSQALRASMLQKIKEDYGVTVDNVNLVPGKHGRINYVLPEGVAEQIASETGTEVFMHMVSIHHIIKKVNTKYGSEGSGFVKPAGSYFGNPFSGPEKPIIDEVAKTVVNLVTRGLISTVNRFNEGLPYSGMSENQDMATGGADYIYLSPHGYKFNEGHALIKYDNDVKIWIDPKNVYSRTDLYANRNDKYGQRIIGANSISNSAPGGYETMLKHGIDVVAPGNIVELPPQFYDRVMEMLDDMGISEINGTPIADVIVNSGALKEQAQTKNTKSVEPEVTSAVESVGGNVNALTLGEVQALLLMSGAAHTYGYLPKDSKVIAAGWDAAGTVKKSDRSDVALNNGLTLPRLYVLHPNGAMYALEPEILAQSSGGATVSFMDSDWTNDVLGVITDDSKVHSILPFSGRVSVKDYSEYEEMDPEWLSFSGTAITVAGQKEAGLPVNNKSQNTFESYTKYIESILKATRAGKDNDEKVAMYSGQFSRLFSLFMSDIGDVVDSNGRSLRSVISENLLMIRNKILSLSPDKPLISAGNKRKDSRKLSKVDYDEFMVYKNYISLDDMGKAVIETIDGDTEGVIRPVYYVGVEPTVDENMNVVQTYVMVETDREGVGQYLLDKGTSLVVDPETNEMKFSSNGTQYMIRAPRPSDKKLAQERA